MIDPTTSPAIGVVGAGVMGVGIAELAAARGYDVVLIDVTPTALEIARARMTASLERARARTTDAPEPLEALARLRTGTEVRDLADCPLVIEAVRESYDDKAALIRQLDAVVASDAVIASNTSSIPITRIAAASSSPERVVGLHFFNPAPAMPVVELIGTPLAAEAALEAARVFAADGLGKTVVRAPDRSGFLVNALLVPYLLSAARSLQDGVASREEIDDAMTGACGMPMGPLRLCDLIGLDTLVLVADSLYAEHRSAEFVAPSLLRRHAEAGLLGRKAGRGFYEYA